MAIVEPGTGDAPNIDPGMYTVTCIAVEETTMASQFDGKGPRAVFKAHLRVHGTDDGEGNEIVLDPILNKSWWDGGGKGNPSALWVYANALCGPQDPEIPFDTDNMIGKTAQAVIELKPNGWPKVSKMLPPKKNGNTPAAPKPNTSPALVNFMGEVDWPKFWSECDKLCGSREKAKEAVLALVNGDLQNLDGMEPTTVIDLYEALKERAVPFA